MVLVEVVLVVAVVVVWISNDMGIWREDSNVQIQAAWAARSGNDIACREDDSLVVCVDAAADGDGDPLMVCCG